MNRLSSMRKLLHVLREAVRLGAFPFEKTDYERGYRDALADVLSNIEEGKPANGGRK
jgi:hypothetical protein